MTYEAYRYVFIIALILCAVLFVVATLLFFLLNVPKIIRDLSGITAKRAIREIREQNEKTGDKSYKVSQVNRDRGRLTDKISPSGRIVKQAETMKIGYGVETEKIGTAKTAVEMPYGNETTVLENTAGETSVLDDATMLLYTSGETAVLSDQTNEETSLLTAENTTVIESAYGVPGFFIEFDITLIHTNEVISMEAM